MASALLAALLLSCSGPVDRPVLTTPTTRESPTVSLSPIAELTRPGGGALQTHATVAWGAEDRFLVTFVVGVEPATGAVLQLFEADGTEVLPAAPLNAEQTVADKPDVEWDGARYVFAWTDLQGRVYVGSVDADGAPLGPSQLLYDGDLQTDAVDLAVQPDGSGVALWTEYDAVFTTDDAGRIVWRAFDAALAGSSGALEADASSRKTADASPLPDGGWVAVWARDYDHPSIPGEVVYEVWGRLYRGDGTAWTFRADDLDTAWPSRPAVAARDDGTLAVSWRDKTEAEGSGLGSGAYGRFFDADAAPLGPSIALGPDHDGDRVVVGWVGDLAVYAWQETDPDGLPGVILSLVDPETLEIVIDRLAIHEPGGERDERPSIAVRERDGSWDVLVVWEAIGAEGLGEGLRARTVTIDPG